MKVALVSPYDLLQPGGVNSHVTQLARQLRALGHEVRLIGPASARPPNEEHTLVAPGRVFPLAANGSTAHLDLSPRDFQWMRAVLQRERFEVVHVHEPLVPVLPLAALWRSTAANVGTFHAHYDRSALHTLARPFLRLFLARLDARIAVSPAALRSASAQFPGHYRIVPLAVDLTAFAREAEPLARFADGRVNLLFVGRLDARKGLDHLLAAFAQVRGERQQTRLIVVGPLDRSAERYLRRASELGLGLEAAVFVGAVDQQALPRYYATADVVCSPALGGESFGMVLLEAMAAGKPVLATRIGGYADLVREWREALLVPPGDEQALTRALSLLVDNEGLRRRLGAEGRRRVEQFAWPRIVRRIVAIYEEALALRGARAA